MLKEFVLNKIKETANKKMDGKIPLSVDNTLAAIQVIKRKILLISLIFGLISNVLFIAFYIYMIFDKFDDSLAHTICYALLALLLVISSVFDIFFYQNNHRPMNYLERRKYEWQKTIKRRSVTIAKTLIKGFSVGYAIYELVTFEYTTKKLLAILASLTLLIVQSIASFMIDLLLRFVDYFLLAIHQDISDSGLAHIIDKDHKEKEIATNLTRTKRDLKILKEIEEEKKFLAHTRELDKNLRHIIVSQVEENANDENKDSS